MTRRRTVFAAAMLLALSILYCLPHHPSAGRHVVLDGVLHVGAFAAIGLWFAWATAGRARVAIALGLLAALLEVAQWRLGGYAHVEWMDIASNEVGLALSWLAARSMRNRYAG